MSSKTTTRVYTPIDPKTTIPKEMVVKKSNIFLKIRKIQFQKNKRKTQTLPLSKTLVFSERSLSQQQVARRQPIRKQNSKRNGYHKKVQHFLEIRKIHSQKNRRNTITSMKQVYRFFADKLSPLSQQHVVRRQ